MENDLALWQRQCSLLYEICVEHYNYHSLLSSIQYGQITTRTIPPNIESTMMRLRRRMYKIRNDCVLTLDSLATFDDVCVELVEDCRAVVDSDLCAANEELLLNLKYKIDMPFY